MVTRFAKDEMKVQITRTTRTTKNPNRAFCSKDPTNEKARVVWVSHFYASHCGVRVSIVTMRRGGIVS
jgi:hypothetical protein